MKPVAFERITLEAAHFMSGHFTLLKTDRGWKIVSAAYSVEPGPQTENPAGPPH